MTGRDANGFGMVVLVLGLIVALVGPFLSGGKGHSKENTSFNWYVLGGLAILVGVCLMYS